MSWEPHTAVGWPESTSSNLPRLSGGLWRTRSVQAYKVSSWLIQPRPCYCPLNLGPALPRLMLREIIALDRSPDKLVGSERDSSWLAHCLWPFAATHKACMAWEHFWEPPVLERHLVFERPKLSPDWKSTVYSPCWSPLRKTLQGCPPVRCLLISLRSLFLCFCIPSCGLFQSQRKANLRERNRWLLHPRFGMLLFFYWARRPLNTSNTLLNPQCPPPTPEPHHNACSAFSRGWRVPRKLPVCSDAWPLPLGSRFAAEGERGRVGGMKGKRASERDTKIHLFWVGWLIFFSLERAALNPIRASCQLCPRVPCGSRKQMQMAD